MTQVVDSVVGAVSRTYDGLDDLLSEASPPGSITYQYDGAKRRTSMTVAGQPAVNYAWDNANRVTGITQSTVPTATSVGFSYDNAERRISLTLPNGIVLSYAYDNDSRVTAMSWMAGTNQVGDLEYSYDADGHVIEKTGSLAATGIPSAVSGNTFNAANEMTSFNGTALTYDLNGNLLNDGTNTYTWDGRNHLSTLTGSGTLPTNASFIYDALSRRFEKTINQQTTAFLFDGWNPVQELMPSGLGQFAPTANMLTGLGIDEFFQRNDVNGPQSFITDTLGSTLALTNAAGSISTSYTYEPFGNVAISPSATNTDPYQFSGRENDETGIDYYRERYYNSQLQTFIAQDHIEPAGQGSNLYSFVGNDPLDWIDPEGLLRLPKDPSGLPPEWQPDPTHLYPNGQRFRDPNGNTLDWHPGRPGMPGMRGKNHWHCNRDKKWNKKKDEHYLPGEEIPPDALPPSPSPNDGSGDKSIIILGDLVIAGGAVIGVLVYAGPILVLAF